MSSRHVATYHLQRCSLCKILSGWLYSQLAGGESARTAGLLLLPGCLLGALMAPFAGRLLDRFGAARPVLGGSVLVIVTLLLFAVCGRVLTTPLFMLFYTLYACGQGLAVGNAMTHGLRHLPPQLSADGNAVLNTLQQLAGAVGTSVAASIVAAAQAHAPDDLALGTLTGSQYAFFLLAGWRSSRWAARCAGCVRCIVHKVATFADDFLQNLFKILGNRIFPYACVGN